MPDIELRMERLDQLFDNLDPAPFHAKALDRNAEAYLLESAGEYGARQPLTIAIHAPASLGEHLADIASAIHTHFSLAHRQAERRHRRRRRIGRVALSAGVATIAIALLLRRWVEAIGGANGSGSFSGSDFSRPRGLACIAGHISVSIRWRNRSLPQRFCR